MKKILSMLVAIMFAIQPMVAYADPVWGNNFKPPSGDYNDFIRLDREQYIVNSLNGSTRILHEPGTYTIPEYEDDEWGMTSEYYRSFENHKYSNGHVVYMSSVYLHDGEYWGLERNGHGYVFISGWIRMSELLVTYTVNDFIEQNKNQFYSSPDTSDDILKTKNLVIWLWPGSDGEKIIINSTDDDDDWWMRNDFGIIYSNNLYIDYKRREWRQVSMPHRWYKNTPYDFWICASEPTNRDIEPFYPAQTLPWNFNGVYEWEMPNLPPLSPPIPITTTAAITTAPPETTTTTTTATTTTTTTTIATTPIPETTATPTETTDSNTSRMILIIAIMVVLILGIGVFIRFLHKGEGK